METAHQSAVLRHMEICSLPLYFLFFCVLLVCGRLNGDIKLLRYHGNSATNVCFL